MRKNQSLNLIEGNNMRSRHHIDEGVTHITLVLQGKRKFKQKALLKNHSSNKTICKKSIP